MDRELYALHSMKSSTVTALRANVVLFSVSTGIAIVPCLGVGLPSGLLDDDMTTWPQKGSVFLIASLVMLLLRWHARRAFDSAIQTHKVQLIEEAGLKASIDSDCPRAWLVQLHLELRGRRCGG